MRQNVHGDNWSDSVTETPLLGYTYDATANDSDKTFTVPLNEQWRITWAHVILVTTATVGNRQVNLVVKDSSGNVAIDVSAGAVQAASLTRHYSYMQGIFRETAFVDAELEVPLPVDLYLLPGWSLTFKDSAAIAAAADDMTISFQYKRMVV